VDTTAPSWNRPDPRGAAAAVSFTVLIGEQGFALKTGDGNLAPGCEGFGPGLAVPRAGGGYDYDALALCARRVKAAHPELPADPQVTISANPNVDYATVVATADALRRDRDGALFPSILFGVVR
jgi:hypothetical protein